MLDVWVLGRVGYDLYAREHNRPLSAVETFERRLGGSTANMAVGLARLGLSVGIVSAVADDLLADYLLDFLRAERVDTRFVARVAGVNTSLCLTEVWPPEHFRQVFYRANAADMQIRIPADALAEIGKAKMFVTNGTNLAADPARTAALTALRTAHSSHARTVLDVDYRASSWASADDAGKQAREALPWVDVVLANEEELALLTGCAEPDKQIQQVLEAGPQVLVRKLGAQGVTAHTRSSTCTAESCTESLVCAIGGGDGFASGFLYALYKGLDLPAALAYGNAAAAVVVSRVSCSDAMPYLAELEAKVKCARSAS